MAERNPFLEVKSIVQPTAQPVDTFVQPAPVSDARLRELNTFLSNMTPRVKKFAAIEQGRKEKKDIERAKKAYADLLDLNLSYDELVKKGEISPEESPVFRFAFHEAKGESLGYEFIQNASEAYFRSNLVGQTSTAGFDDWFNNYKKNFIKNNELTLNELGAFDPFNNLTKQAQSSLMNQHLSNVRKNVSSGASDTSLKLIKQISNNALAEAGGDPSLVDWKAIGTIIHAKRSELAKVSKKPFKEINDETLEDLSKLFAGFDNPIYFENLISGMKTSGGASLGDTLQGNLFLADLTQEINKNLNTQTTRNNQVKKQWENTTQTTLTGIVRPFILDSGSELLATKVIITDPNGNDIKTNFFKLANEAGLNNIDILDNDRPLTEGNWLRLIEAMAAKGTIKTIDGYEFPNGEIVNQILLEGMGEYADADWRNTFIKNLGEEITSRGSTAQLSAEVMTRYKNEIMEMGLRGEFMDRVNIILQSDKTINKQDAKELYNFALGLQKTWQSRQNTLQDREDARNILVSDRDAANQKKISDDKFDLTDDPFYLEQKRLFEASIAEALLGGNITTEIARRRKNIFLNSYVNAVLDPKIDYYRLSRKEKFELLQSFQQYARTQTQSKNNEIFIPLEDASGKYIYDDEGFILMSIVKNN